MAKRLGSLWQHKKDNKTYLNGEIEVVAGVKTKIVVFKNDKKTNPKQPDWNIVLSEPMKDKLSKQPIAEKIEEL